MSADTSSRPFRTAAVIILATAALVLLYRHTAGRRMLAETTVEPPPVEGRFENGIDATSSSHASSGCRLLLLDAEVVWATEDPLARRVARSLGRALQELPPMRRVRVRAWPIHDTPGERKPSLFVVVATETEEDVPGESIYRATVRVQCANDPFRSRASYSDHLSLPVLRFDHRITLRHEGIFAKNESVEARRRASAEDIQHQVWISIRDHLAGLREAHGAWSAIPPALFPTYEPTPPLPFQTSEDLVAIASHRDLLCPNDSWWTVTPPDDIVAVLTACHREATEAGWRSQRFVTATNDLPGLRLASGSDVLEVFPTERDSSTLAIHFRSRMDRPQVREALRQALRDGAEVDALLPFARFWDAELLEQARPQLAAHPPRTPRARIDLAAVVHRLGHEEEARDMVLDAHVLCKTLGSPAAEIQRLETLAEDLDVSLNEDEVMAAERLETLGFIDMRGEVPSLRLSLDIDEPLWLWGRSEAGDVLAAIRIQRSQEPTSPFEIVADEYLPPGQHTRSRRGLRLEESDPWQAVPAFAWINGRALRIRRLPLGKPFEVAIGVPEEKGDADGE